MSQIKKLMLKTEHSIEQFYPETHVESVIGLEDYVKKIIQKEEEEKKNDKNSTIIRTKK